MVTEPNPVACAGPPRPSLQRVRVAVLVNQGAFPGLGTIMMGRRVGYLQAAVMIAGFVLSMGFMTYYLACLGSLATHANSTQADFTERIRPHWWALFWGFGLCAAAWCWALASSVSLLREAGRSNPSQDL